MLSALIKKAFDVAGIEAFRSATLKNFIKTRNIDLIVDVGANLGQFAEKTRSTGYSGRILSIEPIRDIYEALSKAKVAQPWERRHTALGKAAGTAVINIPINHTLSSINTIRDNSFDLLGVDPTVIRTEVVQVTTLDDLLKIDNSKNILLKIDTQGYEREVLDGASLTLGRTVGILLELPIEHIYENVWTMNEALAHMDGLGFIPAQFRVVNTMKTDTASAIEVDCLFRKKVGITP